MLLAACYMCALLAAAAARVYTRCDLADELASLGIRRDDIATWVCIAYHESRLDTESRNYGSGDHGLLQISELYWCGPGKACGLTCDKLRDEDIADDVKCALQIHEEHTRIQGDGFLAWVVYPQHCRHNVKKYLVDCDGAPKSVDRSRSDFVFGGSNETQFDEGKTPFLKIKSVFRSSYHNLNSIETNSTSPYLWLNFKVADIDSLKLPVYQRKQDPPNTTLRPTTAKPVITTKTYPTTVRTTHTSSTSDYKGITTRFTPVATKSYPTTARPRFDGFSTKNNLVSFTNTPKTSTKNFSTLRTTKPTTKYTGFPSKGVFTNKPATFTSKYSFSAPRTTSTPLDYKGAFSRKSFEASTTRPIVTTTRRNYAFTTRKSLDRFPAWTSRNATTFPYSGNPTRFPAFTNNPQEKRTTISTRTSQLTTTSDRRDTPESSTKFNIFDFYLNRKPTTSSTKTFTSFQANGRWSNAPSSTTPSPKFQNLERKPPTGGAARNHQFRRQTVV